jgi:arginine utilization protein RocB
LNAKYNENLPDSENIWVFIEGTDKKNEIVVLSAHYDHVGTKNGKFTMAQMMMVQERLVLWRLQESITKSQS